MVQIKIFTNSSLHIENEINLWIEKQAAAVIKEIKIYPTEHGCFAYIIYDNNVIPATSTSNSKVEMWF